MKLLSIKDFSESSFDQKCDIVTIYSNYIMHRDLPHQGKAYLYHTNHFFIEVQYSSLHKKILKIQAFNDLQSIAAYAETISLADLNF